MGKPIKSCVTGVGFCQKEFFNTMTIPSDRGQNPKEERILSLCPIYLSNYNSTSQCFIQQHRENSN